MNNGPTVVRCTIEMDMVEGEHFNSIGFEDHNPPIFATTRQAIEWATNTFIEYLADILSDPAMHGKETIEEYIQVKFVEQPT